MNVFALAILGLAMGLVFGLALEKSRVFEPGAIVGQMQLRNFIMLKVFLSAVITGLVVLAVLNGAFAVTLHPKSLQWAANIAGGLLLGTGLVIAGACPGTVLAQIGAGYRDAWFTLAGALAGAMAYGYLQPALSGTAVLDALGKPTFADLTGLPFWPLALVAALVLALLLAALERRQAWRQELGEDFDGLMPQDRTRPPPSRARHSHAD